MTTYLWYERKPISMIRRTQNMQVVFIEYVYIYLYIPYYTGVWNTSMTFPNFVVVIV